MFIVTIAAQKGGQAKSTVCAHLGYAMLEAGLRVAIIDLDPQASLTEVTFVPSETPNEYTPDVFVPVTKFLGGKLDKTADYWPQETDSFLFVTADHEDFPKDQLKLEHFKANLSALEAAGFDCVLIDTQGGLTGLTRFALQVATHTIMPFQFGGYDIAAIDKTLALINRIRRSDNPNLKVLGMLPCKVKTNSPEIMEALHEAQQGAAGVLKFHLADRVAVQLATQQNRPVWKGAKTGAQRAAAKEWKTVCFEILGELAR